MPSIHSSGCDSGVGLTTQLNNSSKNHLLKTTFDSQRRLDNSTHLANSRRAKRRISGCVGSAAYICSEAEESR